MFKVWTALLLKRNMGFEWASLRERHLCTWLRRNKFSLFVEGRIGIYMHSDWLLDTTQSTPFIALFQAHKSHINVPATLTALNWTCAVRVCTCIPRDKQKLNDKVWMIDEKTMCSIIGRESTKCWSGDFF